VRLVKTISKSQSVIKEFAEYQKETFLSEMRVMKTISLSRSVEKKITAETSTEGEQGKIEMG